MNFKLLRCSIGFFLVGVVGVSCIDTLKGHDGCSDDIEDSKEHGLFVTEYCAQNGRWSINDTLEIEVKSAWLEKQWKHAGGDNRIEMSGYHLILECNEEDLIKYYQSWMIGVDGSAYFRPASKASLISDISEMPNDSLLHWYVQNGSVLSPFLDHDTIGEVRLQRCK